MKYTQTVFSLALAWRMASAYSITADSVSCHALPDTESGVIGLYHGDDDVSITCQTDGPSVNGSTIWDLTSDGCYVSDFLLDTGSEDIVTNQCPSPSSEADSDFSIQADNYPYKGSCGGVDPWNYYKCQCTSFVAFRVNRKLGINFHNRYKGAHWGNANLWDDAARQTGTTINSTPKVNSIAQNNGGTYGHVAWVTAVSGTKVTVEEYNWATREGYGRRTVSKGTFNYIHL